MDTVRFLLVITVFGLVGHLESHNMGGTAFVVMIVGVLAFLLTFHVKEQK